MTEASQSFTGPLDDLEGLSELARNLWWSWHPQAWTLFKRLDRRAWKESGHNPVKMLRVLPADVLRTEAARPEWKQLFGQVMASFRQAVSPDSGWFARTQQDPGRLPLAYFSAEYGLHHCLPFYAGGLGFLAGDFLKEMSDLGVPVVAVGFMYPEGYVRQKIREDGWQESEDQALDRDAASITKVLDKDGRPLTITMSLMEPPIHVAVWKIDVGGVPLYLLDTDVDVNDPWNRKITQRLYSGDLEHRLRQEIVLGIGGSQVLLALGIRHAVLHFNEGHAAFALLERIRERVSNGMSFADAMREVSTTSVFTMHTPVPSGTDVFPFNLIEKYFRSYWPSLGIGREEFFRLGLRPDESARGFNMTALALRLAGFCNAVSMKHACQARRQWHSLWPDRPDDTVPIDPITNGVHLPTWVSPAFQSLFDEFLGGDWREKVDDPKLWDLVDAIPDHALWAAHCRLKTKLIASIRELSRLRWARDRVSASLAAAEGAFLDPALLTIGFARRFATYKRADLIFKDFERLKKILGDPWRPVQIIFAGKAHPADDPGKQLIQRVVNAARNPELGGRVAFVEDYGEWLGQLMVHGVDVWLNNPLPFQEACGTSGMKAAVNGIPHLSNLEGWWAEGFNGKNGWAFEGSGNPDSADPRRDQADASRIYDLLEREVVPLYYDTAGAVVPSAWVRMMKESIKGSGARFSTRRMAKEYIERYYVRAFKKA